MAIPTYQECMLPLLKLAADGAEHRFRSAVEYLAGEFSLSEGERSELLPSGTQPFFDNRVGWANTYLKKAGLLEGTRRGYFRITPRGQEVLSKEPKQIDNAFLENFSEFRDFKETSISVSADDTEQKIEQADEKTPEEQMARGYAILRADLAEELLSQVRAASPTFFERLVIELLLKMGYGGSRRDAAKALGRSGDEGIDGIIKEDKLGLDAIYIQAKRWKDGNTVGRPEIQKFAGALDGQRARKGIFITTSSFSNEAHEYVKLASSRIVLVDGKEFAELMIDNGVGVSTEATYEINAVDYDFFVED